MEKNNCLNLGKKWKIRRKMCFYNGGHSLKPERTDRRLSKSVPADFNMKRVSGKNVKDEISSGVQE